jgi:hypothetical protein
MFVANYKNKKTQINFSRFYLLLSQGWTLYFLHSNIKGSEKDLNLSNFVRLTFSSNYLLPLIENRSVAPFEPSFKGELSVFGIHDARVFSQNTALLSFKNSVSTEFYQLGGFIYNYYLTPLNFFPLLEKVKMTPTHTLLNISTISTYKFFLMFYKRLYFLLISYAHYKSTSKTVS